MNMSLTHWDCFVIGFHFAFIIGVGYLFKHVSKNSSDYFRSSLRWTWARSDPNPQTNERTATKPYET